MTKKELRTHVAETVKGLSWLYREKADRAIRFHIYGWSLYKAAGTVFCYAGTDREIDTRELLNSALIAGKRVVLPVCTGPGIMETRAIQTMGDLVPGKYGILAPGPGCPLVEPEEIDLAFIPCASGNARGERLGYGGGFYDRYLPRLRCPTALLCRKRLAEEEIPMESHDVRMDYFISEDGIVPCQI